MPARADSLSYARRIEAEGPDNLMRYLSTNSELDFATGKEQLSEKNLGSGAQGTFYSGYAETTYSGLLNRLLRRKAKRTPVSLGVTMSPKDIANTARDLTASLARNVEVTDSGYPLPPIEIDGEIQSGGHTPEHVHLDNPDQDSEQPKKFYGEPLN